MELMVLNKSFEAVDVIDTFESAIWTDRYNLYGDFEFTTLDPTRILSSIQHDFYLRLKESDRVMIVEDFEISSTFENGSQMIVTGRSLESLLDRRIIWKKTVLTGNLQTGIQKLLNENVISPTDTNRRVQNFIFEATADPVVTALTIEAQFAGENLLESIKAICDVNNIGFKVTLNDTNQFVFKLYSGKDRTFAQMVNPYVIFSPKFENILNSNYIESKKTLKTVTLVAGEEYNTESDNIKTVLGDYLAGTHTYIDVDPMVIRKTVTVEASGGAGSGLDRREVFTDARDVSQTIDGVKMTDTKYDEQLSYRGSAYLAGNIMTKSFEGQVETTHTFKYGVDYFLGDLVQIVNEFGIESVVRVVEVVRSQNLSGIEVYPTFSNVS